MAIQLTNTLGGTLGATPGGRKEVFEPLEPGRVRMYHCGPTVTGHLNVAKFRSYLLADLLRRHFETAGYEIDQVMNITDVGHLNEYEEDAVEIAAGRTGLSATELVDREERIFHDDRRALHIRDATRYPRAREHIDDMVAMIAELERKGFTYESGGNIYFDSRKSSQLGRLAGKSPAELEKTVPCEGGKASQKKKRHPLDIDLWRTDVAHQIHWPSPWGRGFPGWHVECVAMSRKYLQGSFDIHTGTCENIFPHHECEIAQAEALSGKPLARYWLHTGPVTVDGQTMSRDNKNLVTVRQMLDAGFRGSVIRVALLSEHYRKPLDFGEACMDRNRPKVNAILGFREFLLSAAGEWPTASSGARSAPPPWIAETDARVRAAMDDDLDYPTAINAVVDCVQRLESEQIGNARAALAALESWDRVLGVIS